MPSATEHSPDKAARLLQGLNAAQAEAVTSAATPLRILAGAGSGKIRVLTRRIAHQVLVEGIDPSHVLAVTFTRKTARDAPRSIGVGRGSTTASSSLQRLSASEATGRRVTA